MYNAHVAYPIVNAKDIVTRRTVGRFAREARLGRNLKQEMAATALGMKGRSMITGIERGHLLPSLDLSLRMEKLYEIPRYSFCFLVAKCRVQENSAAILEELQERGAPPLKIRIGFGS